jgi:hypothetical protein
VTIGRTKIAPVVSTATLNSISLAPAGAAEQFDEDVPIVRVLRRIE